MWFSSVLRSCGLAVLQSLRLLCALCPVLCALRPAVTKTDRGRLLTATPPGWTWCYCPLPRAKPGLLDDQPSRLDLVLLSLTPGKTGATGGPALRAGCSHCHFRHLAVSALLKKQPLKLGWSYCHYPRLQVLG